MFEMIPIWVAPAAWAVGLWLGGYFAYRFRKQIRELENQLLMGAAVAQDEFDKAIDAVEDFSDEAKELVKDMVDEMLDHIEEPLYF